MKGAGGPTSVPKGRARWLLLSIGALAFAMACGDSTPVFSGVGGGFGTGGGGGGGTGGSGGIAGTGGSGALPGTGGMTGTGGSGAIPGTGGSGAAGGSGGSGGFGGMAECQRSFLCQECPKEGSTCTSDSDCLPGLANVCVDTGCKTLEGGFIGQCALLDGAGDCEIDDDCDPGYECVDAGAGNHRCIKTTPGCMVTRDCPRGFYCENDDCVDRRVPCLISAHCPKSHFCNVAAAAKFCERAYRSCNDDGDCPRQCVDIDEDGEPECSPTLDTSDPARSCLNSDCGGSDPVCELGDTDVQASCGKYGLCTTDDDCAANFECVALWPDHRSECVPEPENDSCTHISQCDERQVCASPRSGGPPSCQAGLAPPSP